MWDLPWPGIEPMSPALTGKFLTTDPPGKPQETVLFKSDSFSLWKHAAVVDPWTMWVWTVRVHICGFFFSVLHGFTDTWVNWRKSTCKWTHAVQTHVVQRSVVHDPWLVEPVDAGVGGWLRDLRVCRLWYLCGSWNHSLKDTKRWLYNHLKKKSPVTWLKSRKGARWSASSEPLSPSAWPASPHALRSPWASTASSGWNHSNSRWHSSVWTHFAASAFKYVQDCI